MGHRIEFPREVMNFPTVSQFQCHWRKNDKRLEDVLSVFQMTYENEKRELKSNFGFYSAAKNENENGK